MVKKVLTAVALCMVCIAMTAQEKTYVVQRGETLQSIARKFGVSEYRIQECNWNVKTYYAGLRIKLPAIAEERTPDEVFAYEMAHKKLKEAKQEMEKGKTYLALELLEKSLDYKFTDEAAFLAGKLNYGHQNYKKADKYFVMVYDSSILSPSQLQEISDMRGHMMQYYRTLREERAARWQSFREGLAQGLQSTGQQMYAANTYNMGNQNMYGGYQSFGYTGPGMSPAYQLGTGSYVDDVLYNAYAEQNTMQGITQSLNQTMQMTWQQVMNNKPQAPSWDFMEDDYQSHVRFAKANGWIPQDKETWMRQATENRIANNQEYIKETQKIDDEYRAALRDINERELQGRVNNVKMYGDLKTGNYTGSSSYTSSSTTSTSSSTRSTYTPSTTTSTGNDKYTEEPTEREQYKNKKVYKSDYRDTKDKVTLYGRDGDRHFPDLHQMTVYEKNGAYYIYINHQYYQMQDCRWKDFNYYIHYKHMRYIKYKH